MSRALADRIEGTVLTPAEPAFAEEAAAFNTAVVHTPDVIVGAASTADVAAAVRFAAEHGSPVTVQATGHGAHTPISGGLLISTRRLQQVSVDPATRTATVGAGARWAAVLEAAAEHGLTGVPGSSPNVGVVGYLLGGGLGPLARSHGFSSDYLIGATIVTGTGEILEVSEDENAELLWALRGGKGGFGIVTEVRVRLVQLSTLYAGALFFDTEHIEQVLRTWVDWTADADPDVTTSVALVRFPDLDLVPEPFRGRHLLSLRFAYPGSDDEGARLAEPLRTAAPVYLDMLGELPAEQMGAIHSDPDEPGPGWNRGLLLDAIDQDFATALLGALGPGADAPFIAAELRHLGSAAAVDLPAGSAVGGRDAAFTLVLIGVPDPSLFDSVLPRAGDAVIDAIRQWVHPRTNINFAGHPATTEEFESAWPVTSLPRLAGLRRRLDPAGIFPFGPVSV
ncbi:FAD-binding oxidoreductase [Lysobacter korlensis]|uniref:FAD-binding oxidoreductase n=1 Tax=Lysobacter korlensis TaxID=553636 RepID=A0ABV6RTW8_9GAMM